MKSGFPMILILRWFSFAVLLLSLCLNLLILGVWGTKIQATPALLANAFLLTGLVGVFASLILGEQRREIDLLKAQLAGLGSRNAQLK
jgi:hypothetical protein